MPKRHRQCAWIAPCLLAGALAPAAGQSTCSLTGIRHSATLGYPKIGALAHVSGEMLLKATFDANGSPSAVKVLSGPALSDLRQASKNYIESWQVNETPSGQQCTIALSFRIEGEAQCSQGASTVTMTDLRHFQITTYPIVECDPSERDTQIRNHFLFLHWHSKGVDRTK